MRRAALLAAPLVLALAASAAVLAQTAGYELSWGRAAGGGTASTTGGGYELQGTVGQAEAGSMSGGLYSLSGGTMGAVSAAFQQRILLPLVEKGQ